MALLDKRLVYKPFHYPQAYEMWDKAQRAHWVHFEVPMGSDINDWKTKLSATEKNVIGSILKTFTVAEVLVENFWTKVSSYFKHPEIQMLAAVNANFETIHSAGYSYLNESLGLENYAEFLQDEIYKARIDRLTIKQPKTKEGIAKNLAIFSAFTEGVSLFSSFAVLMSFSQRNLLKGVGQIVAWSIRDESLHSEAGCWLFNTLVKEYPEILTEKFKEDIYEAARLTVKMEDEFIDKAFELGSIEGIDAADLKTYIRARANTKLNDIGFGSNWKNIDKESLKRMSWFDHFSTGVVIEDFFAVTPTSYSKSNESWDDIFNET